MGNGHRVGVIGLMMLLLSGCALFADRPEPLAVLPIISPQASRHNLAGIQAYHAGKWDLAKQEFSTAIQHDPTLAEAHFNLALTFHQLGDHQQAAIHFKKAGELAPHNREILASSWYRHHLGLSSTFERHGRGGCQDNPVPMNE